MPHMTPRPADVLADVTARLAAPDCGADSLFAPVAAYLLDRFALGLVTISHRDASDGSFLRLYSSLPGAYAAQGRKPANETEWSRHVIDRKKTFLANDYQAMAAVMYDHEKIRALGLESIVNIPIICRGEVIGTLNCLGPAEHFDAGMIAGCEEMRLPVAAALLMLHGAPA